MKGHDATVFFAAPSARGFSPYRNAVCIDQSTFRDYFVAALLVPLLRNGANQELSSRKSSKKKEMRSFQGLLRPFGARAAFGGVNRQRGHKIRSLRSVCTFRDYFVASLLVPPSAERTDSTGTKYAPCGVCALSGTTSPLRGSCHCFAMGRTKSSPPTKVARKKRCKNASLFSWCTFRDSNPGPID